MRCAAGSRLPLRRGRRPQWCPRRRRPPPNPRRLRCRTRSPPAAAGLEEALTLRWGVWLGAGALLLAGVFLVRMAVEEGWLGPELRCGLAGLLGLGLILGAAWLRRRPAAERPNIPAGIPWPDQVPAALAAGGVAILFGAAYATGVMYALVPPLLGFALLALVALGGIALALVFGPVVAAIGIAGAYLTPALVETRDPSLPGLFLYLLAVTAAALVVLRQVGARLARLVRHRRGGGLGGGWRHDRGRTGRSLAAGPVRPGGGGAACGPAARRGAGNGARPPAGLPALHGAGRGGAGAGARRQRLRPGGGRAAVLPGRARAGHTGAAAGAAALGRGVGRAVAAARLGHPRLAAGG